MTKRIWVVLAAGWFFMCGVWATKATADVTPKLSHGKAIYQMWRGDATAPLSIVVIKHCLSEEDSAAHLRLVDYSHAKVVLGCAHRGY